MPLSPYLPEHMGSATIAPGGPFVARINEDYVRYGAVVRQIDMKIQA